MDNTPSVFSIPGLYRLNLVIVYIPTSPVFRGDRGQVEQTFEKVGFYLQLDPVRGNVTDQQSGAVAFTTNEFEGYVVGAESGNPIEVEGVKPWNLSSLPESIKPGSKAIAYINGIECQIRFETCGQFSLDILEVAGFGQRVRIRVLAIQRGGDGV